MSDRVKDNGKCPHCNDRVLRKSGDVLQLRAHGPVEFHTNLCKTKCHWCKGSIELPVQMALGAEVPGERFILQGSSK